MKIIILTFGQNQPKVNSLLVTDANAVNVTVVPTSIKKKTEQYMLLKVVLLLITIEYIKLPNQSFQLTPKKPGATELDRYKD